MRRNDRRPRLPEPGGERNQHPHSPDGTGDSSAHIAIERAEYESDRVAQILAGGFCGAQGYVEYMDRNYPGWKTW